MIVWDARDGKQLHLMQAHQMAVTSMNFSEDRMLMATCSKERMKQLLLPLHHQ